MCGERVPGRLVDPCPLLELGDTPQGVPPGQNNEPRRGPRQGTSIQCVRLSCPVLRRMGPHPVYNILLKRLSATDISALASMKNVAKCDTWCELQNPVNHRVFERKLRPKPSGRGHVCLGVTHRVSPHPTLVWEKGEEDGLPHLTGRGWPKNGASGHGLLRRMVVYKALPRKHRVAQHVAREDS